MINRGGPAIAVFCVLESALKRTIYNRTNKTIDYPPYFRILAATTK